MHLLCYVSAGIRLELQWDKSTKDILWGYENYMIRMGDMIIIVGKDLLHDFDENCYDYNFGIQKYRAEGI